MNPILVATGVIIFDDSTKLTINVYPDGVKIFAPKDPEDKEESKDILVWNSSTLTSFTSGQGNLVFTNFLVAIQGTPVPASLDFSSSALTLTVDVNDPGQPFSQLPNVNFEQLKVVLTQNSGGEIVCQEASATMKLMGVDVPLTGTLNGQGLVFSLPSSPTSPNEILIPNIGKANLSTVEIKTNQGRWEDLQLLYNFDEAADGLVLENSGSHPKLKLTLEETTWISQGGLSIPKYTSDKNVKVSTRQPITPVLNAIKDNDNAAFTIELWVRPTPDTVSPGTILSIGVDKGNPQDIFFQLRQILEGQVTVSGTFLSAFTTAFKLKQGENNHIVFTHDSSASEQRLYVNGEYIANTVNPSDIDWAHPVSPILALGNIPGEDVSNSWHGEYYFLAIYSRALTEEEVLNHFRPDISTEGDFTITNVPPPLLDTAFPATFDLTREQSNVVVEDMTTELIVRPELQLSKLHLTWKQIGQEAWELTGSVDAAFWGNKVTLAAKLIGTDTIPLLEFTETASVSLGLDDWGDFDFPGLTLNVPDENDIKWSLTTIRNDPPFVILPAISFRSFDPFSDFMLLDYELSLDDTNLLLHGTWMGEALTWHASRRGQELIMHAVAAFNMHFGVEIPPIYDTNTGVKLKEGAQLTQQVMEIDLDLELSRNGILTKVTGQFDWQDADPPRAILPSFTLYTPPPNKNALLGHLIEELQSKAGELFRQKGQHAFDFYIGEQTVDNQQQVAIFLGQNNSPANPNTSVLPKLFDATTDLTISSSSLIFELLQSESDSQTTLTIAFDPQSQSQEDLNADYEDLWSQIATNSPLPGAVNLLRRRIAERLPLAYSHVLQYYYGWNGNYIDLVPGMRLRVDFQNYQFVHVTDQSARRGFVGSGSNYFYLNSYHNNGSGELLGFDPFLSQLQVDSVLNLSQNGAGGVLDLLRSGGRKAYYRLIYPSKAGSDVGPERVAAIVGAASAAGLATATAEMLDNGSVTQTSDGIGIYFRGKATLTPEIQVFVQEEALYVPVGTTWRQLLERFSDIPVASLGGQDLSKYMGDSRPLRMLHEGVNSEPAYVFINPGAYQVYQGKQDLFDLPVVKGDRFFF